MRGFNFEKNLIHQTQAVKSTIAVFENLDIKSAVGADKQYINPKFDLDSYRFANNIYKIQDRNKIDFNLSDKDSNIIDIMMETGTGKTYTYTKTIFELNKNFGIFKFVVIVPTLSIKAGTIDFLNSDSAREHFKEQYKKTIKLHIVKSGKSKKNKKSSMPSAIDSFVNAGNYDKNSIQVMIINAGMINSETMQKSFDKGLFDKYTIPFEAIKAVKPFVIIDEPHKFDSNGKTWKNILKINPQFILRYGATFPDKEIKQKDYLTGKMEKIKVKDYQNLIYTLTAVNAFNNNLVKGVIGHITEFESGKNAIVKFINSDGNEAIFELLESGKKELAKISKKESLQKIHLKMSDLFIENLNKSTVVLSNGLIMKKGDKINPYSYAQKLQETMLQKAIKNHFEIEKQYLTRDVKIKPLTLFFIDNIEEYRNKDGYIRNTIEELIKAEVENLLKTEENEFYKSYLEKTLKDISLTHAGYFSKDNLAKDEVIEKEINEILHDKGALLDLNNPRRFIFSKWTLKEGWDNPNIFQICKLRSSGSEISKLQEVGRGLRLPVNEYGNRVKDEQFYLNYFVDFTESDFVDKLVNEINEKSGAISIEEIPEKLNEKMIKQIIDKYDFDDENSLFQKLIMQDKVIDFSHKFLDDGYDYIKKNYPLIFEGVGSNKIRKSTDTKKQITVRTEKYIDLKELWERLNEKVILEYKFDSEDDFKELFISFLEKQKDNFTIDGIKERELKVEIQDKYAILSEEISILNDKLTPISTLKYSDFIKELSKVLNINLKTIHQAMIESSIEIDKYLNPITIRIIKHNFNNFLMFNAIDKFSIEYQKVSNSIHPTKFTDKKGNVLSKISASDVGVLHSDDNVANSYFFEELFYDSELEKENIKQDIKEVVVFTKIPKNSIKIPVAGGKSYSPDFAYVINYENGEKKLHFIVETKNVNGEDDLREEEKQKIKHAKKFFNDDVKIEFKTQFSNTKIVDLINTILNKEK
jgi:type III restriction enzyme